jgi:hypothetical protein
MWSLIHPEEGGYVVDHLGFLNAMAAPPASTSPLLLGAQGQNQGQNHGQTGHGPGNQHVSMMLGSDIPVDCTSVFVQVLQQVKVKFQPEVGISSYTWIGMELSVDPFSAAGAKWLDEVSTCCYKICYVYTEDMLVRKLFICYSHTTNSPLPSCENLTCDCTVHPGVIPAVYDVYFTFLWCVSCTCGDVHTP